jgi:outer membrane autotransporter protein
VGPNGSVIETTLAGDLVHQDDAAIVFDIDASNGISDTLVVEGSAELHGQVAVNPVSLTKSQTLVLSATEGVQAGASFETIPTYLFSFEPTLDPSTLTLTTDAEFVDTEGVARANSSLARHLQSIWNTGDLGFGEAFADMAAINSPESYSDALDVLSGRAVLSVTAARLEASMRLVDSAFSCPTFVGESALLSDRTCAWARAEGTYFDRDQSGDAVDYRGQAFTTMIGGQRQINGNWFVGGVLGYENSSLSSDLGSSDVDGDAILAVAALKHQSGPLTLSGALDLGFGSFDSDRTIAIGDRQAIASASSDTFNAGIHLRAAYQFVQDQWYFQPSVDLRATYLRLNGYEEEGAGAFDLKVEDSDGGVFSLTPAIRVGRRIQMNSGALLNAYAEAGIRLFDGNDWTSSARFADAPVTTNGFSTTLDTPDQVGRVNFGVEVFEAGRVNIQAEYQAEFADAYLAQSAQLRLTWRF